MHPIIFYLLATAAITATTTAGLYIISQNFSQQNLYPPESIVKGTSDTKEYTLFTLPNQMKVIIVASNHTESSAAVLRVNTGYMLDPPDFPGMAHFVEHIVQLGTEKYPHQELYRKVLSQHAGYSSAQTTDIDTTFGYQIQNSAFFTVFDIFSRFFVDPLFNHNSIDKEIQSVHNEWKNSLASEDHKIWYVMRLLSKKDHPFGKFSNGNLKTLIEEPQKTGSNPYVELKKFYRSSYSANRMSLVICTQKKMVQKVKELTFEYFEQIMDKQLQDVSFLKFGIPIQNSHNFVRLHTESDEKDLVIFFNLQAQSNMDSKMIQFMAYFLMNFFEDNFCTEQISNKRVSICEWLIYEVPNEYAFFVVEMKLTGQKEIDIIIKSFFSRVNQMQTVDQVTFEQYYQTLHDIQQIQFDFEEQKGQILNMANQLSNKLNFHFGKQVLIDSEVLDSSQFDWKYLSSLLKDGMNAKNVNFILKSNFTHGMSSDNNSYITAKQLQKQLGLISSGNGSFIDQNVIAFQQNQKVRVKRRSDRRKQIDDDLNTESQEQKPEEDQELEAEAEEMAQDYDDEFDFSFDKLQSLWTTPINEFQQSYLYGIHYLKSKISQSSLKVLNEKQNTYQLMNLETLNDYMPMDFTIKTNQSQTNTPHSQSKQLKDYQYPELLESSSSGNLWWIQDTILNLPKVSIRVLFICLGYSKLDTDNAGAVLTLMALQLRRQIRLDLEKYKMLALEKIDISHSSFGTIEISYTCYSDMVEQITSKIFDIVQKFKQLKNQEELNKLIQMAQVTQQDAHQSVLYENGLGYLKLLLTNTPPFKDLKKLTLNDYNKLHQTFSNQQRREVLMFGNIDSIEARSIWTKIISPKSKATENELPVMKVLKLARHPITYRTRFQIYDLYNVVTINYYQGLERTISQYMFMQLIQHSLNTYAIDYLSVQLQLGYIVTCQIMTIGLIDSLVIVVQSPSYDPEEIDFYIEECLGHYETFLAKLSIRDFQIMVESLKKELNSVPTDLNSQADLVWSAIKQGDYQFMLRECVVESLNKIVKLDLQKFFQMLFKTRNGKISLQLYNPHNEQIIPTQVLREQDTFARQKSKFIKNQDELNKELNESYEYQHKLVTEQPKYIC